MSRNTRPVRSALTKASAGFLRSLFLGRKLPGTLDDTPQRMAEAWRFWTSGYDVDVPKLFKTFDESSASATMVFQGSIPFWSTCEHHLAPIWGVAHIGYITNGRVLGLSKFSRVVDAFARRLTVQERITRQIADAFEWSPLNPLGVGVVLQCRHACMESRGVCKRGTITMTSELRGDMMNEPAARAEFMGFVQSASQGFQAL